MGSVRFLDVLESVLCSSRLHLFDNKYQKTVIFWKYYYNLQIKLQAAIRGQAPKAPQTEQHSKHFKHSNVGVVAQCGAGRAKTAEIE